MISISFYKKFLSCLYPVMLRRSSSRKNPILELFVFRGQYQLATYDALYSDGNRYRPLVKAFRTISHSLPKVNNVLILGTGLGSAVQILAKYKLHPAYTFVDDDELVLKWAMELLPGPRENIDVICGSAEEVIDTLTETYDLVVIDVFESRVVPFFVTSKDFLEKCRQRTNPGGHIVLNYIINSKNDWKTAKANIDAIFPGNNCFDLGINQVITAQA